MGLVTVLIPLPVLYNPEGGQRKTIEVEKFTETAKELSAIAGGGGMMWRFEPGTGPRGYWWNRGILHEDESAVFEMDIPDTPQACACVEGYAKEVLLDRFRQEAIYVKYYGGMGGVRTVTIRR